MIFAMIAMIFVTNALGTGCDFAEIAGGVVNHSLPSKYLSSVVNYFAVCVMSAIAGLCHGWLPILKITKPKEGAWGGFMAGVTSLCHNLDSLANSDKLLARMFLCWLLLRSLNLSLRHFLRLGDLWSILTSSLVSTIPWETLSAGRNASSSFVVYLPVGFRYFLLMVPVNW